MTINKNDVIELNLGNVSYKMYLPYKDTDFIQKVIYTTKKPYEYDILQDMVSRMPAGSYVLDVGMNIANHSLYFAANGLNVIAFEANPKMIAMARENIKLSALEDKITINECGVSDAAGSAIYEEEYAENYGGMSLTTIESNADSNANTGGGGGKSPLISKDSIESKSLESGILSREISDFKITLKTIDSFNITQKIALIKMDIEGMEHKALKGARHLIESNRPIMYLEANHGSDLLKIERVLEGLRYVHWDFYSYRMHLYLPIESVNEKQMLAKILSNTALGVLHTDDISLIHINDINNRIDSIDSKIKGSTSYIVKKQKLIRNLSLSIISAFSIIIIAILMWKL